MITFYFLQTRILQESYLIFALVYQILMRRNVKCRNKIIIIIIIIITSKWHQLRQSTWCSLETKRIKITSFVGSATHSTSFICTSLLEVYNSTT